MREGPSAIQETALQDEQARRRIRESLGESLLVEAAAGTGKTTELINRIVAVLQKGVAPSVDGVVAVTFTRKAAGELKLRLRQELDGARHRTQDPEEIANLERALARLEEARIGTIHAFCAELLRERPVEARVDPAFAELSEDEAPRLFDRAFRLWIQEQLKDLPPGLRRALSRCSLQDQNWGRSPLELIRGAGWTLAEWRDFDAPWQRSPFPREETIDNLVEKVTELAQLSDGCPDTWDYLYQALAPLRVLDSWIRRAELERSRDYDWLEAQFIRLLTSLRRNKRKGRGRYSKKVARQTLLRLREELICRLEAFREAADADLAWLLRRELEPLVHRYETLKKQAGRLDFVDLLIRVRDLLCHNQEVRNHWQRQFTHIFVDEFQDTDPLQVQILLLLTADDPRESDPDRARPLPGKLFLVGDPKQSIYRFRRADVALYERVRTQLEKAGVGIVQLSHSFRSLRPLQLFVNAAFQEEMGGDPATGQPAYVPLLGGCPAIPDQPSLVALPVPRPYGRYGITNQAIEASLPEAVGAFIQWLLEESSWRVRDPEDPSRLVPVRPRHICILFRRFLSWGADMTRPYVRSLEVRGIPHVLVGARSFHQREEVETLRVALTAVEWPDDELAVYATLRGGLFAISDETLLRFRQQVGSLHPFRPLPQEAAGEFAPIEEALLLLKELHKRRNLRPIVDTLNELLGATRAHAGFALRPAGHQVLANVQRVCDLARTFETGGGTSFRAFVEYLTQEAENPQSAEAPVLEEASEGVRIMTVHAAKGLEFPAVLLADLTASLASSQPDKYVDLEKGLAAVKLLGCAPQELLLHREEESGRDAAEGIRIAYVAATRARDLLVVPAVGDGERGGWLGPLNKALYPPPESFREAQPAPGCPPFASSSVLARPSQYDGHPDNSVRPGLHQARQGGHQVVWWDPACLNLEVRPNFGLSQTALLEEGEGQALQAGKELFERWQSRKERALELGSRPRLRILTPSEIETDPPGFAAFIQVEVLQHGERPSGARFGTLVHALLRDVDLRAADTSLAQLARLHGKILQASREEIQAAQTALRAVLGHPLLQRAARAERLFREYPFLLRLDHETLLEGTLDLAFLEEGTWYVLDFKTDLQKEAPSEAYRRQLSWYLFALHRLTGQACRGVLLGV